MVNADLSVDGTAVLVASTLLGTATLLASHFVLQAIAGVDEFRIAAWHREESRWHCLRENSATFRALQPWIIGLSQMLERYCSWFVHPVTPASKVGQFSAWVFKLVLGNVAKLRTAVQTLNAVAPWSVSETIACGCLLATLATAMTAVVIIDASTTYRGYLILVGIWLIAYRVWCGSAISRGEYRRRCIRRFLPHAMDSVAMVMASGDTFRTGIETVIRDFPDHALSQDLQRLRNELDRGQTMTAALQTTASSVNLPEFDEMVRVLVRIHQHGTPAAESFVRLAKQLRVSHLRHMEEEVGRAEASMALPTMLVMASCMIVSAAPFVLSIMQSSMFK